MFETSNIETPSLLKDFQYPKEQLTKETVIYIYIINIFMK